MEQYYGRTEHGDKNGAFYATQNHCAGTGGHHDETLSNHDESVGYCVDAMEHYIRAGKCCDGSEVSYDEYGAQG